MKLFDKLVFDFQLSKYIHGMPFLMIRDCGIKESYSMSEVKSITLRYSFNYKYIAIGYAMFCNDNLYYETQSTELDTMAIKKIRRKILNDYFPGKKYFSLSDLMVLSKFKGYPTEIDVEPNPEYWDIMSKLDEQTAHQMLNGSPDYIGDHESSTSQSSSIDNIEFSNTPRVQEITENFIFLFWLWSIAILIIFLAISIYIFNMGPILIFWYLAWILIGLGAAILTLPIVIAEFALSEKYDEVDIYMLIPIMLWLTVPASIFLLILEILG